MAAYRVIWRQDYIDGTDVYREIEDIPTLHEALRLMTDAMRGFDPRETDSGYAMLYEGESTGLLTLTYRRKFGWDVTALGGRGVYPGSIDED